MPWPIRHEDVRAAEGRLRPHLAETPLRSYAELDAAVGCRVLVKHENHLPTNSFKVRNALAALTALPRDECRRGVIAASRGNHGQGLAYAGALLGVPVTVCVPEGNNPDKNRAICGFGARLVEAGCDYDESIRAAEELARGEGLRMVHSTNDCGVLAGAGTITLEILRQAEAMGGSVDAMFISVGGGSQAVGALTVLRGRGLTVPVVGVQPANAPTIHDSYHAGRRTVAPTLPSIADGMATRDVYGLTFDALREGLTDMVTVTEGEIADAMRLLLSATHNLCEGAGAVGLAGLRKLSPRFAGRTVAVILSGANVDAGTLRKVLNGEA